MTVNEKKANPLISVIVPIYRVEPFLRRCVDSILAQMYQPLEIILVDDGSPDRCGIICDEYAEANQNIHVIHKTNGGLSDARNCGVNQAKGEYIAFVDSDDYISSDYFEYLYALIKKYDAEISMCYKVNTDGNNAEFAQIDKISPEIVLSGIEACKALLDPKQYSHMVTACGKLYKAELVSENPFPVGKIHEDAATTCKYYYSSNKVVLGSRCLYAYYQNKKGIMSSLGDNINYDKIWTYSHRAEFFEDKNELVLAGAAWNLLLDYFLNELKGNRGQYNSYIWELDKKECLPETAKRNIAIYRVSPLLYRICEQVKYMAYLSKYFAKKYYHRIFCTEK